MQTKPYDLMGIGIGPFNLGLAAMLQDHPEINALFIDQKPGFDWHPGIALPWSRMQVPYFADLITLANPQSRFTYINYLKETGGLFRFGAQENIFPLRIEYNNYYKWVAGQLPNLIFNHRCEKITYNEEEKIYTVHCKAADMCHKMFHAKRLVIGVGTVPYIPEGIPISPYARIIHSGDYLYHKHGIIQSKDISVIGSGQSAAEIYYDLLQNADQLTHLNWFTRSRHIAPMDYSRFALEMTTPDYVDYFFHLPKTAKKRILQTQGYLYKGINQQLIEDIHNQQHILYANNHPLLTRVRTAMELTGVQASRQKLDVSFIHSDTKASHKHQTNFLILATGYQYKMPSFLQPLKDHINWNADHYYDVAEQYTIDNAQTIFVQNADLNSHGFNAADLGLGAYRNMVIVNKLLNKPYYAIERNTTSQVFDGNANNLYVKEPRH